MKCVKVCFLCLRMKTVLISQAEAEKIRKIGEAEAFSIEALGKAEAEKMRLKAEAYQQYGEAAKTALVLEALPKVNSESVDNRREAVCTTVVYSHSYSPHFVNVLLQIASKVAAPLSKTNEIVILSGKGSQVTGEVNRLLAELPVSVNALTGVDLSKVITCLGS